MSLLFQDNIVYGAYGVNGLFSAITRMPHIHVTATVKM